jgi:protein-S-isoprenylcysteine O-methyltransferase Ste14
LLLSSVFSGGNLSKGVREDRGNRWVIVAFGLLDAYLPAYTDRKEFWILDGDAIRWLGVVLLTTGGALRIWPVSVLGRRFSGLVAIQPGHKLVASGVYGFIRHPSYLGLLVNSRGWVSPFVPESACCYGAPYPATRRAHTYGRGTAALAFRRRVRCLLQTHVAPSSWRLLGGLPPNMRSVANRTLPLLADTGRARLSVH